MKVSVIVCTHNPRPDFLDRALGSLQAQTLPAAQWELLVVDNDSAAPLAPGLCLAGHPHHRVVREETLGLARARLRGIAETGGDVLVFVDDDNVLDGNYLEQALAIAEKHPRLGAWSGAVRPQFEQPPPAWTRRYWEMLAVREITGDRPGVVPFGAGLCLRRPVAAHYCRRVADNPLRLALGRVGGNPVSADDLDLAQCATDMGLEMGVFAALRLTHLIPTHRLTEEYLLRLAEAMEFSNLFFAWLNTPDEIPPRITLKKKIKAGYDAIRKFGRQRRFHQARRRGHRAFYQVLPLLQTPARHLEAAEWIRTWNTGAPGAAGQEPPGRRR